MIELGAAASLNWSVTPGYLSHLSHLSFSPLSSVLHTTDLSGIPWTCQVCFHYLRAFERAPPSAWKSLPQIGTGLIHLPPSGLFSEGNFLVRTSWPLFKITPHRLVPPPTLPISFPGLLFFFFFSLMHITISHTVNCISLFCLLSVSPCRMEAP